MSDLPPNTCSECPVLKNSLFKDFNQDLIDHLASKRQFHVLEKHDVLFNQGQDVEGIFCHLDGLALVVQKDVNGNARFSRLVLPGDTSGHRSLFIDNQYKGSTIVISKNLKACFIRKAEILYLLSNNASLARNLIIKISEELNRSENEAISFKERNVRSRLANLLYDLGNEYADHCGQSQRIIKSEITKKDIASLLMVANETVIRLMSEMKSEGLISYEAKRIKINDMEKMRIMSRIQPDK